MTSIVIVIDRNKETYSLHTCNGGDCPLKVEFSIQFKLNYQGTQFGLFVAFLPVTTRIGSRGSPVPTIENKE